MVFPPCPRPRVLLAIWIETVVPLTPTVAAIASPGRTTILIVTGPAGTSSYQTVYVGRPAALQFASVPVCSSACDASSKPPRPTQKAE
jgi:hypothetical protein